MKDFVTKLKENVDQKIREIESRGDNVLQRSLAAAELLEDAFHRLKGFISAYEFADMEEEISFFKEIKPQIFCHLIYYRKVFNLEMNRPMGSLDAQAEYLTKELDHISDYISKRLDFYRYYRSGSTNRDHLYFKRGVMDWNEQYVDGFYFERDPVFSTCGDFTVAKILSCDMLQMYLREELRQIDNNKLILSETPQRPIDGPKWTDKKAALIELLYGLDSMGCFDDGNATLRKLQEYFELYFGVRLGNISRAFNEMKIRNDPTPFLDHLKEVLMERMKREDSTQLNIFTKKKE